MSPAQAACANYGGFVAGAQFFDERAFGISLSETAAMDPMQRNLLELGYSALHLACMRRSILLGGSTGIFLAIERPDWVLAMPPPARASVYAVTGDNVSVAAGRLCFVLGTQGPCASIDTACSSAMTAMHNAAHAVRDGECGRPDSAALALGIKFNLLPQSTLFGAAAGMLSVDGRCKTLDASANGYVRSEGAAVCVVQACSGSRDSAALQYSGSAVRQDGRSASLTAPNGSAQRTLILAAIERAALVPVEVQCVELHGTGTGLGDPTEAGSLASVQAGSREAPLTVGAAKSNLVTAIRTRTLLTSSSCSCAGAAAPRSRSPVSFGSLKGPEQL